MSHFILVLCLGTRYAILSADCVCLGQQSLRDRVATGVQSAVLCYCVRYVAAVIIKDLDLVAKD